MGADIQLNLCRLQFTTWQTQSFFFVLSALYVCVKMREYNDRRQTLLHAHEAEYERKTLQYSIVRSSEFMTSKEKSGLCWKDRHISDMFF